MKRKSIWWLVAISCLVLAKVILGKYLVYSYLKHFVSIEQIKVHSAWLRALAQNHYAASVVTFVLGYAALISLGIPGVVVFSLLGGFLFGSLLGTFYATLAATLGSSAVFLIIRYLLREPVQRRYARQFARFNHYMERYGSSFLLIIHFLAVIPFLIINVLAALTPVRLSTFVWTTIVGFVPLCWIYAAAGSKLSKLSSFDDIFSWPVVVMLMVLIAMAIVPIWIKHRYAHGER